MLINLPKLKISFDEKCIQNVQEQMNTTYERKTGCFIIHVCRQLRARRVRCYHYSMMFGWEPEGCYCCIKYMVIAPFWFSVVNALLVLSRRCKNIHHLLLYPLLWSKRRQFSWNGVRQGLSDIGCDKKVKGRWEEAWGGFIWTSAHVRTRQQTFRLKKTCQLTCRTGPP